MTLRKVSLYTAGLLFIAAGTLHFTRSAWYTAIVPPPLPAKEQLVAISGIAEILGGAGLLVPATRRVAAYGLIALLIAVFPANIYMASESVRFAKIAPAWALYARLPLQFVLIAWLWTLRGDEAP
jgi:uncharacterized membrane protein